MKLSCGLRACFMLEDAINFRFFFPRTFPQTTNQRLPEVVPGMFTAFIRVTSTIRPISVCNKPKEKQPQKQRRFSTCETPSTSACGPQCGRDKGSPSACLVRKIRRRSRKYKYGEVRSRDHFKTTPNMFSACVGLPLRPMPAESDIAECSDAPSHPPPPPVFFSLSLLSSTCPAGIEHRFFVGRHRN